MSMRGECDQVVMCVRHCVSSVETCVWGFWQVQSTPGGRSRTILETYHRSCGTVPSVSYTRQRYAAKCAVGCVSRPARVLMDMAPTINMSILSNKSSCPRRRCLPHCTAFDSQTPFHPSQRSFSLHPSSFPPLLSSCRPLNHHPLTRSRLLIVLSVTTSSGV
jgi:hypothetical protein